MKCRACAPFSWASWPLWSKNRGRHWGGTAFCWKISAEECFRPWFSAWSTKIFWVLPKYYIWGVPGQTVRFKTREGAWEASKKKSCWYGVHLFNLAEMLRCSHLWQLRSLGALSASERCGLRLAFGSDETLLSPTAPGQWSNRTSPRMNWLWFGDWYTWQAVEEQNSLHLKKMGTSAGVGASPANLKISFLTLLI